MKLEILPGALAGAVGTVALNVTTNLDVAGRGRAPSPVPEEVIAKVTDKSGMPLSRSGDHSEQARHRRSGLAGLAGYATGIGVGIAYGVLRPRLAHVPTPAAGLVVGVAAMAATDLSAVRLGVTDPRSWGIRGWLADVIPHAAYGLATAGAFERLRASR